MKLDKIFTEVRFEQSLLFDDARTLNSIVKELKPIFPTFENNHDEKMLAFLNRDKQVKCYIHSNRIIVDCDEPKDFQVFKEMSSRVIPYVMGKLDVEVTERIGVRAHYVTDSITTETESSNAIVQKFFNIATNEFIHKHANGNILQPRTGFMFKVGIEYFVNVNIGFRVVGEVQVNGIGQQQIANHATSPMTDLDVHTNVPKRPDQITGILRFSCDKIAEYSHMVWK